jgi:voltage-gated sodium channel
VTTVEATTGDDLRSRMKAVVESNWFRNTVLAIIIFNAVTLGMATSKSITAQIGGALELIDDIILGIFVVELTMKLFVYRWRFFLSGWNLLDFVLVGISLAPASANLSVLRGLRILRAMRLFAAVPQMRAVIQALVDALPGMGAVVFMLLIIFYIFAVIATGLFGESFPQWFGTVGESLYSLFQIMTLESWSMGIVRPVMEVYPNAWALFVPFIISTAFAVLNLFIGLLVNTMQAAVEAETEAEMEKLRQLVRAENDQIAHKIDELRDELRAARKDSDGADPSA